MVFYGCVLPMRYVACPSVPCSACVRVLQPFWPKLVVVHICSFCLRLQATLLLAPRHVAAQGALLAVCLATTCACTCVRLVGHFLIRASRSAGCEPVAVARVLLEASVLTRMGGVVILVVCCSRQALSGVWMRLRFPHALAATYARLSPKKPGACSANFACRPLGFELRQPRPIVVTSSTGDPMHNLECLALAMGCSLAQVDVRRMS